VKNRELEEVKKVFAGERLEIKFRFRRIGCWLGLLVSAVLKPFKAFVEWTIDYSGFGAEIVKAVPVLLMFAFVLYPWWSYPFWTSLGHRVGSPLNYLVLAVWLLQWLLAFVGTAVIGYIREK